MTGTVGYAGKRAFDVVAASALLVVTSPLLIILAVWVGFTMGWPVLFKQRRPGLHGEVFDIVKFRTMREAFDADGYPLPDAQRLTRTGRFLRRTSLDELPELINVLKGEMSLVGPRPLYEKYLGYYRTREGRRFDVRPGITGLAQVRGRNDLPWDERLELDVEYVENMSLKADLGILARTIGVVLGATGVSVDPDQVEEDLDVERRRLGFGGTD